MLPEVSPFAWCSVILWGYLCLLCNSWFQALALLWDLCVVWISSGLWVRWELSQCSSHLVSADLDGSDLLFCSRFIFSTSWKVAYLGKEKQRGCWEVCCWADYPGSSGPSSYSISFTTEQLCSIKMCCVFGGRSVNEDSDYNLCHFSAVWKWGRSRGQRKRRSLRSFPYPIQQQAFYLPWCKSCHR